VVGGNTSRFAVELVRGIDIWRVEVIPRTP
jgi:hypothetical protein